MSAEIDEYPSLCFQDIRKQTVSRTDIWMDRHTEGQCENSIPRHKQSVRGYKNDLQKIIRSRVEGMIEEHKKDKD